MCPSIEELKNVWLPFSIQMKMTKNKGLDVCNWTDGDEMQVVEKLGRGGGIRERRLGNSLVVQWLGLGTSLLGPWVQFPGVRELKSRKPCGMTEKQKGEVGAEAGQGTGGTQCGGASRASYSPAPGLSRVTQFSAGSHSWARMESAHPGPLSPYPKLPVLYPPSPSFPNLKLSLAAWVPPHSGAQPGQRRRMVSMCMT